MAGTTHRRKLQALTLVGVGLLTLVASAELHVSETPAFHNALPTKALPATLREDQMVGEYFVHTYQSTAYRMARAVPQEIYQMPCYCRCDLALGHKSLHSCFENTHGATCSICMKETAYVYRQNKEGKTAAQIRAGIERGEFRDIDLRTISMN